MKNKTSEWFECGVSYLKLNDKGETKEVKEKYVVEAPTFGNAEETVINKLIDCVKDGGVTVKTVARPKYQEICFSEETKDEIFYKVKVLEKELNEIDGNIKDVPRFFLVQSSSVEGARNAIINTVYTGSVIDYEIASISKTTIIDVCETISND